MLAALLAAPTLAVLELRSKLEGAAKKQVDASYFTDVIRTKALEAAPGLTVMTRENVLVLIKASGKTLEQCEGECEVETGRLLGADLIATGDLVQIGTQLKMTLKLHDTHSGRLLSGATASGGNVDDLDAATASAVQKLLAPIAAGAEQLKLFEGAWRCSSPEAGDSEEKWSRRPDGSWTFSSSQVEGETVVSYDPKRRLFISRGPQNESAAKVAFKGGHVVWSAEEMQITYDVSGRELKMKAEMNEAVVLTKSCVR